MPQSAVSFSRQSCCQVIKCTYPNFRINTVDSRYFDLLNSLSQPRLSQIKNWSLPKHENLTTSNKILWKRGEISSFPQYFQYISNFKRPITYTFVKCGCSIKFFFNSAMLICRGTNISKYFRESRGIQDNESRLYCSRCPSI